MQEKLCLLEIFWFCVVPINKFLDAVADGHRDIKRICEELQPNSFGSYRKESVRQ